MFVILCHLCLVDKLSLDCHLDSGKWFSCQIWLKYKFSECFYLKLAYNYLISENDVSAPQAAPPFLLESHILPACARLHGHRSRWPGSHTGQWAQFKAQLAWPDTTWPDLTQPTRIDRPDGPNMIWTNLTRPTWLTWPDPTWPDLYRADPTRSDLTSDLTCE